MNETDLNKAMFYIWKNQIIGLYKIKPEVSSYPVSEIYALSRNCYPIFQEDEETEFFSSSFDISKDFAESVLNFIDDGDLKSEYYTYYEIERKFGHSNRGKLIDLLRYTFLDERFSSLVWEKLLSDAPIEANAITREFDISEL